MSEKNRFEAAESVIVLVGIFEGLLPFVAKIFGWRPLLSLPVHLPAPAWWIVAASVVLVALVLLEAIDRRKKRAAS